LWKRCPHFVLVRDRGLPDDAPEAEELISTLVFSTGLTTPSSSSGLCSGLSSSSISLETFDSLKGDQHTLQQCPAQGPPLLAFTGVFRGSLSKLAILSVENEHINKMAKKRPPRALPQPLARGGLEIFIDIVGIMGKCGFYDGSG
jgi:hypothetical protein